MTIADTSALVDLMQLDMGEVSGSLTPDQLTRAAEAALAELGWSLPSTSTQDYWLSKRAVRHAVYMLLIMTAPKFKYNNINLQQRFEHYKSLIWVMDTEYGSAVKDNQIMFVNITPGKLFGEVIPAGFVYDAIGNDITYGA